MKNGQIEVKDIDRVIEEERKNLEALRHKNKMEELAFERETEIIKFTKIHEIENIKHQWHLEEQRINWAEQKRLIVMKANYYKGKWKE